MTANIYSILKKVVCVSFASAALCAGAFSAEGAGWTLAAEQFKLSQKGASSPATEAAARTLPSLVLEQLAENLMRMPRATEQLDRKLYDFRTERLSLFLQLSKEVQARDSLVLSGISQKRLAAKIKEADKKVGEIQDKIDANLAAEAAEREKYAPRIERDAERERRLREGGVVDDESRGRGSFSQMLRDFVSRGDSDEGVLESVVLYQNDVFRLFDAGAEKSAEGYQSYAFEKACVDAGIRGLITGTITIYGSYMSVSAALYQYPGAREIARAVEVGQTEELKHIATGLALQLTPKIADSMPVELTFSIQPEEAAADVTVTVDDVVYRGLPESLTVTSGVHTVMFSASGFASASTSYSFTGNRRFHIEAALSENNDGAVQLRLKKLFSGEVYANGLYFGGISAENRFSSISINNMPVLGHFVSEDGSAADFYVPQNLLSDGALLTVDARPFDRSDYIEKRRRWLYASYSALIVSLLPSFYTYGNYYAAANSYNSGSGVSYEKAKNWQLASGISIGISASCGVFFIYELVRYLKAANSVLPAPARPLGRRELRLLEESAAQPADAGAEAADGAEASDGLEAPDDSERQQLPAEGE
ncbi:MAG: hypothetical protein K2H09_08335 [Treponemataceae bacterium]|nr:hypothetical protein [Treponemataceae bacterium]